MILNPKSLASLLILVAFVATHVAAETPGKSLVTGGIRTSTLTPLQDRLNEIDVGLEQLASLSLRSGIGAIGYRSRRYDSSDHTDWIQVELDGVKSIDQVVLVPTIWRDARTGFRADGFPLEFHLIVGHGDDTSGTTVARYDLEDLLLPRIAPLVVDCPAGTSGSWVRLIATSLGARLWDGRHDLQLSEFMVFSGEENVALHAKVEVSSSDTLTTFIAPQLMVDGHVPYLMDATAGQKSIAFVSPVDRGVQARLTIDLGEVQEINRVHLHSVDTSDTAPQSHGTDFAIPRRLQVVGAKQRDFSDASILCDIRVDSIYDSGPITMRRFSSVDCRFVSLIVIEPYVQSKNGDSDLGYAEIELFSHGRNVALGKPVVANFDHGRRGRQLAALTDGHNFYGEILSLRDWMNQLARRHELERQRPRVLAELSRQYARQSSQLNMARLLIATLAVAIGFVLLGTQLFRLRQLARIKQRFAADVHDEVGANLHTIGLLSDLAGEAEQGNSRQAEYLNRIRSLTERTTISMRHLVDAQSRSELYLDFPSEMRLAAKRIAVNLDHEIEVEGEAYVRQLKPRTRVDLLLFYKECLVNISRHSGATQLRTHMVAGENVIRLTVSDNGRGLSESHLRVAPRSLRRRAKLLGARVHVEETESDGAEIHLVLPTRRWGFRK